MPSKRAEIVHLTFKSFLAMFACEMRCPGLALIPNRHAEVCLVGLAHFATCFHGILSRSCLYKLSTHIAKCICWVQTTSWCDLNQIILIKLLFNYNSLFSYSAIAQTKMLVRVTCAFILVCRLRTFWKVLKVSWKF